MPRLITFPRVTDPRGSLSFAQGLPFQIMRVYWLHDLSADAVRGGHAHKTLERILIAVSGSFIAEIDDQEVPLNKPWFGLCVHPYEWLEMHSFSGGATVMVLASEEFSESDYIRSKEQYLAVSTYENKTPIRIIP